MFLKLKTWIKNSDTFEVMAIFAIILGAIIMGLTFWLGTENDINLTGKSADIIDLSEYIGGLVGSLWSLAGVLLFYASLSSQKEDLERQKELLVKQIDEVVAQTKEFRIQNEMAKEQKNEETFFQLLRFHSEIISTITIEQQEVDFVSGENLNKSIQGRKAFVEYYDIYKRFFQEASESNYSHDEEGLSKIFDKAYNSFYLEYQADLGHYFRNLYNLILFIDGLKVTQQKFYIGLLMAQLSNYELTLLFFHCLRSTNKDFKLLVEKYAILDQVPKDEVTSMAHSLYDLKAFGESGFGSGDVIEDDEEASFDSESPESNIDTDSILSKFNLPNMSGEVDSEETIEKFEEDKNPKDIGTMDDILSKLKNLSSEKFPDFQELDDLDTENVEEESPLNKLKDKKTLEEEELIKEQEENNDSELSFEDFFDDGEENSFDEDDEIIDLDQIAKIESENFLKKEEEDNSDDEDLDFDNNKENKDLADDFSDLWDEDVDLGENSNEDEDAIDPELDTLKKSLVKDSDDEFESLKTSISDDDTDYGDLKSLIDSDIDEDSMLFNKDADIKNEKSIFDKELNKNQDDDDIQSVKNKFNLDFDKLESSNEDAFEFNDEENLESLENDSDSDITDFNFDEDITSDEEEINLDEKDNDINTDSKDESVENENKKKIKVKVNSKKNNKGGKGFLSKLN